ncbi:unnamed protein product, partial [Prorocentrum cordatum]
KKPDHNNKKPPRRAPWADKPHHGKPDQFLAILDQLPADLRASEHGLALAKEIEDRTKAQKLAAQANPEAVHLRMAKAIRVANQEKAKLQSLSVRLRSAQEYLEQCKKDQLEQASINVEAEAERVEAVRAYEATTIQGAGPGTTQDGRRVVFAFDAGLFDDLDQCEDEAKNSLLTWKEELERHQREMEEGQRRLQELLQTVRATVEAPASKKRKNPAGEGVAADPTPAEAKAKASAAQAPKGTAKPTPEQQKAAAEQAAEAALAAVNAESAASSSTVAAAAKGATKYVHEKRDCYSIVALVETHIGPAATQDMRIQLQKDSWKASVTPAFRKYSGFSGGEMVIARKHIAATTMDQMRKD